MSSEQVIFDLDGTLADNRHREHLIEGEDKEWREYLDRCDEDLVVEKTREKMSELSESYEIVILTCRSDEVKEKTCEWLKQNEVDYDRLVMLPEGRWKIEDSRFKKDELRSIENPVMAFDDKASNCEMFLKEGLKVFKVGNLPKPNFELFQ